MEFNYIADVDHQILKRFLKRKGISKRLLAKVKFQGGDLLVNDQQVNAIYRLMSGDRVKVIAPDETPSEDLIAESFPLDILYEDDDYLVINKPAHHASITGRDKPTNSMSNFVAGYLQERNYPDQKVHIVTRLDTDTTGCMLFAKHSFAHSAMIDNVENRKKFVKRYYAMIPYDPDFPQEAVIDAPIGRREGSIIERCVRFDGKLEAKSAQTSYKMALGHEEVEMLDVQIHTGRTHQIRVHFAYKGHPLYGDELYGGDMSKIQRQALHCHYLRFDNLFTGKTIEVECPLPEDMAQMIGQ